MQRRSRAMAALRVDRGKKGLQSRRWDALKAAPTLACFALGWLGYQLAKQTRSHSIDGKSGEKLLTQQVRQALDIHSARGHTVAYSDLQRRLLLHWSGPVDTSFRNSDQGKGKCTVKVC